LLIVNEFPGRMEGRKERIVNCQLSMSTLEGEKEERGKLGRGEAGKLREQLFT